MKLNGWQRIGIVLSVVWALGAGIHTHNSDVDAANSFAKWAYKVCSDSKSLKHDNDLSSCDQERKKNLETWKKGDDGNVAFTALAPIPFGWLTAFILIYVIRAQIVGFRAVVQWRRLGWLKKAFVVFCTFATTITILFGITAVLNLYVDTEVPVSLAQPATVTKVGDDVVVAQGTWTRSGDTQGSAMGDPLQTSKIECVKQEHRCTETEAYVSVFGNILETDSKVYDVQSWTPDAIVFRNDLMCATEIFTIDMNTEAVTGAGHPSNFDDPWCKLNPSEEKRWAYQLSDGFKVYWEQRQKARPYLLRFIQSLFGN